MLRIIASAYEDGYCIVEEASGAFLLRPPYHSGSKRPVSQENVKRAIAGYGFATENQVFDDWDDLIQHLIRQLIEKRKMAGRGKADNGTVRRMVRRIPEHRVIEFLDRIELELIPNHEWRAAISLLTNLLKNKVMTKNTVLLNRCVDLLDKSNIAKEEDEVARLIYAVHDERSVADEFPLAVATYGEEVVSLNQRVQDDKQILFAGIG